MAEKEKIVYILTHGAEDPERASLPFVLASAAQAMEVEAVVALQGTSVFLAKKGCLEHVFAAGLPPLKTWSTILMKAGGCWCACPVSGSAKSAKPIWRAI